MILGLMVSTLSVLRLLKIAYNVQVQTTARRLGGLAILHFVEQSSCGATNSTSPCSYTLKLVFYVFCFTIKPIIMTTTKKRAPGAPPA